MSESVPPLALRDANVEDLATPSPQSRKGTRKSPRRTPRVRRSQSSVELTSPISRLEESRRWDDVVAGRTAHGIVSPLKIHVNPLRLFEPKRVHTVTGSLPKFDVVLPDPFLATPDRRHHRQMLDRSARQLSFQLESGSTGVGVSAYQQMSSSSLSSSSSSLGVASLGGSVTPRHVRVEETTALLSPVPSSPGNSPARKLRRKRASRRLASKTLPALGARSELEWGVNQIGAPRGGSLVGLVGWALREGAAEHRSALILAHTAFCSGVEFLTAVRQAFVADSSPNRVSRQQGLVVLFQWIQQLPWSYGGPQHVNSKLLDELDEFVKHTASLHAQMTEEHNAHARFYKMAPEVATAMAQLRQAASDARGRQTKDDSARYFDQPTDGSTLPILRQDADVRALHPWYIPSEDGDASVLSSFKGVDVRRLAQALTVVDAHLLMSVSGEDLLHGARSGPAVVASGEAGTVTRHSLVCATRHWNMLSRWAPSVILWAQAKPGKDVRKVRAKLLRKFIDLAVELRALENWSALFALVVGLGSGALSLRDSWNLVPPRHVAQFRELEEVCQPIANFRSYRVALDKCVESKTFCIPYLAIVLKDFEAISEGNPSKINARGWFNFDKMQLLSEALAAVQRLQSVPCPLKMPDKKYVHMATHFFVKSEQELWEHSTILKAQEQEMMQNQKKSLRHAFFKSGNQN